MKDFRIKKECLNCKNEFTSYSCRNRKFCSKECHYSFGKKKLPLCADCSIELKEHRSTRCNKCSAAYKVKLIGKKPNNCSKCSKILSSNVAKMCRDCWKQNVDRGENSPQWRDGSKTLALKIRHSPRYKEWHKEVFIRDDYRCIGCGVRSGRIIVDHITPFALILLIENIKSLDDISDTSYLWNIKNGQTLCQDCHEQTDSYLKKPTEGDRRYAKMIRTPTWFLDRLTTVDINN